MKRIIFVYNADSGLFNKLTDFAHKMLSPKTYDCNLCAITHPIRMNDDWKEFIETLDLNVEFLHRDELKAAYGNIETLLPAVFDAENQDLKLLISAEEINRCKTVNDLKKLVSAKVKG